MRTHVHILESIGLAPSAGSTIFCEFIVLHNSGYSRLVGLTSTTKKGGLGGVEITNSVTFVEVEEMPIGNRHALRTK
jgi:hypothetical protein